MSACIEFWCDKCGEESATVDCTLGVRVDESLPNGWTIFDNCWVQCPTCARGDDK